VHCEFNSIRIKPLDVAAKGVENATMFEDFASEVKYLIDTASKVREQKQKSKVTYEISFSKSSDFWDKPVSSVFIKRKICFSDPFFVMKSNLCEIS
jgi:hypothetical protein